MADDFAACKANIEGTLGREMTPEEKRAIRNRAPEVMKKIANSDGSPGAVSRILQDFKDAADARKAFNQRANAIEYRAVTEFIERFNKANATIKHAGEALKSITRGSLWSFRGSNDSLANLIDREISARRMAFDADLHQAGLLDIAYSGKLDEKIIGAEEQLRKGQPIDPKWGTQAIKIAEIFEKHTESARLDMNANGAWIPKNDDRLFAMRYDHNRIASGDGRFKWGSDEAKNHYVEEYMKRMDWDKAFGGDFARATDEQRRQRIGAIWQQFRDDTHLKGTPDFYGPGKTYGISPHTEMVLKTPADSYAIYKQFGRGSSLAEGHNTELGRLGQQLAMMKVLGVRAEKAFKQAFYTLHTNLIKTGETAQAKLLEDAFNDEMQNTWRLLTDTVAHPNDNVIGRIMSAIRMTVNTTATAFSLPTLIGDLNLRAVRMADQGRGMWLKNLVDHAVMQFTPKGLTEAEQAQMFAQIGISLEINRRPVDIGIQEHRVYDGVRRANGIVRGFTGHSIWDNSARLSSMIRDFMHYNDISGSTWDDLNLGERKTLAEFGIDRFGWDVMRKAQSVDIPGNWGKGITPDAIRAMDLDEFRSLTPIQHPSAVTLKRMRDRLADQYRNLLGENANRNVSAPSTARLARLRAGRSFYDPNTIHGWAMTQAIALKGWAINYMTEHLGRGILKQYDEHVSTGQLFKDLMTGQNLGGLKTTAQYMVGGVALAYISNAIRSLAKGQAPVNPLGTKPGASITEQPWFDAWSEAMARGAAGIYGDFLFGQGSARDPSHPLENKFAKLVTGPEAEFYLSVGDTLAKTTGDLLKKGNHTQLLRRDEQRAFGVGYHALPPSNLLATKWALDYFFFNALSEQINPGYQKRLKDYAKSQNTHYLAGSPGLK